VSEEKLIFPGDWSEEDRFAFKKCLSKPDRHETWEDVFCPLQSFIDNIRQDWPEAPNGLPGLHAANWIVHAVRELRVAAIHFDKAYGASSSHNGPTIEYSPPIKITAVETFRPGSTFPRPTGFLEPRSAWEELNQLVSAGIGQWQREINLGRTKPFLLLLKEIGKALIPQAKGKGKKGLAINRFDVAFYYYKMFFRVTSTARLLKQPGKPPGERIRLASERYHLPVADIKTLWKIDEDNSPAGRPLSLKEMARILTAKHFKITQHRVSNIIAS